MVTALSDLPAGELWPAERIQSIVDELKEHDLKLLGIESVNVHDSIKAGGADRDFYIDRYIETLKMLSSFDIQLICYNFMPIFDWTRTDLAKVREDGSTVLAYDHSLLSNSSADEIISEMRKKQNDYILPGWDLRGWILCNNFSPYMRILMRKLYLIILSISLKPLCQLVRNTILRWQYTQMIHHGQYSTYQG